MSIAIPMTLILTTFLDLRKRDREGGNKRQNDGSTQIQRFFFVSQMPLQKQTNHWHTEG